MRFNVLISLQGMISAEQGVKGARSFFMNDLCDDGNEVLHHQIRRPGGLQRGKGIEQVQHAAFRSFADALIDVHCKGLEAVRQRCLVHLEPVRIERRAVEQRVAAGIVDVDHFFAVFLGVFRERKDRLPEIRHRHDGPDHVFRHIGILHDPGKRLLIFI